MNQPLELPHFVSRSILVREGNEAVMRDDRRSRVDQRMERHLLRVHQTLVNDHTDLVLHVVDLREQRQMTLLHAQLLLQQRLVREAQRAALVLQVLHSTPRSVPTLVSFFMSTVVSYAATLSLIHI